MSRFNSFQAHVAPQAKAFNIEEAFWDGMENGSKEDPGQGLVCSNVELWFWIGVSGSLAPDGIYKSWQGRWVNFFLGFIHWLSGG